jgi:hypothetical protein
MAYKIQANIYPLIKAFEDSIRLEKAQGEVVEEIRSLEREERELELRTVEVPEEYGIAMPGKTRREAQIMKSETPGMTPDEATDYFDNPLGVDDAVQDKSNENESQFATLQGRKPEKQDVKILDAKRVLGEAVRRGKLSIEAASTIEDRLNAGTAKPADVVREVEPLFGLLGKSQSRRISRADAMKAVSRAVRAGAITLQESEIGLERIRTGKTSPEEAIQKLTSRVQGINRKKMLESAPRPKQGTPKYRGLSLKGVDEYNRIVAADPLALVRM